MTGIRFLPVFTLLSTEKFLFLKNPLKLMTVKILNRVREKNMKILTSRSRQKNLSLSLTAVEIHLKIGVDFIYWVVILTLTLVVNLCKGPRDPD